MNDTMNEITAFSPFGGRLVLEEVKGAQERANVPENSIETKAGDDRSMYVYVPASGCPDAKQTQVVMFLRDGADEASAQAAMQEYGLDALAEKEHFVLCAGCDIQRRKPLHCRAWVYRGRTLWHSGLPGRAGRTARMCDSDEKYAPRSDPR